MPISRFVFVHMEKCAGQSVNRWLGELLGENWVTPNLVGDHRQLIRDYGGAYSVISGHIEFDGTGLDPRYGYISLLREPLDRLLSWVYFVLSIDAADEYLLELKRGAKIFLESGAKETNQTFMRTIKNPYSVRLCRVLSVAHIGHVEMANLVLSVLKSFICVGKYGFFDEFQVGVAQAFGVENFSPFPHVNSTSKRALVSDFGASFLDRCAEFVATDLEVYKQIFGTENVYVKGGAVHSKKNSGETRYYWDKPTHPIPAYWRNTHFCMFLGATLTSMVGQKSGFGRESDGAFGFLTLGPYLELSAGNYELYITGEWLTRGAIYLIEIYDLDLCEVISVQFLTDWGVPDLLFRMSFLFSLTKMRKNIEVRVLVPALHKIRVDSVTVAAADAVEFAAQGDLGSRHFLGCEDSFNMVSCDNKYVKDPDGLALTRINEDCTVSYGLYKGLISTYRTGVLCSFALPEAVDTPPHFVKHNFIVMLLGHCGPRGLGGARLAITDHLGGVVEYPLIGAMHQDYDPQIAAPVDVQMREGRMGSKLAIIVEAQSELFVRAVIYKSV